MDKKHSFKRLASSRTGKVIQALHVLGHCSNKNYYEYTEGDIDTIFLTLKREINATKSKFKNKKTFKLLPHP